MNKYRIYKTLLLMNVYRKQNNQNQILFTKFANTFKCLILNTGDVVRRHTLSYSAKGHCIILQQKPKPSTTAW